MFHHHRKFLLHVILIHRQGRSLTTISFKLLPMFML
ncbi:hypothetical protein LINPERPRIM_LOCUS6439 [Linum perenne]